MLSSRSLNEIGCLALVGSSKPGDVFVFQTLVGLLLSNGPGTISAQGAKGAVAADGPEDPERVQLNKAMVGFLTHSGYAHGGNGYEGIAFLIDQFRGSDLSDPGEPEHGLDLQGFGVALCRGLCALQVDQEVSPAVSRSRRSPASIIRCSRTSR